MTTQTQVKVGILDPTAASQEFVEAWKRAENGEVPIEPTERIYFQDMEILLKTLTPKRWKLLKVLHKLGPFSIRALSKSINRDYKNVYNDVQLLNGIGLLIKDTQGKLSAPWKSITFEMCL